MEGGKQELKSKQHTNSGLPLGARMAPSVPIRVDMHLQKEC